MSDPINLDNYDIIKTLQESNSCKVYLLKIKEGKEVDKQEEMLVLKRIAINNIEKDVAESIEFEANLCSILRHKNIVKCLSTSQIKEENGRNYQYLILEYANGGDLMSVFEKNIEISENETKNIMKDILHALEYCHSMRICHHDLKPENILIFEDEKSRIYKLADWGLGEQTDVFLKKFKGTLQYVAPEILYRKGYYCDKSDMWALGIVAYMCIENNFPFELVRNKDVLTLVDYKNYKHASKQAQNFIDKLLQKEPQKRPSATEALQDEWLK